MTPSVTALKYPLDRTGTAASNRIINEERSVGREVYRAIAPYAGSFYTKSMEVVDKATGLPLTLNTDYKILYPYQEAELEIGKPICTIVQVLNSSVTDVYLTYQCVGGPYTSSRDVLAKLISDLQQDNRAVTWDNLLGKPVEFNPTKHLHSAADLYGLEYVVLALEELVQAVYTGDVSSHDVLYNYIDRIKAYLDSQLDGLNRADIDLRNEIERLDIRIDGVIASLNQTNDNLEAHILDTSNPHKVTKAQVGLGAVENYRPATQEEAETGTSLNTVMTPLRGLQQITKYASVNIIPQLTTHIADTSNPHKVTATQVGLGNVTNNPQVIRGGGPNMLTNVIRLGWDGTQILAQVDNTSMGRIHTTNQPDPNIAAHTGNKNNPHGTTKSHVGLGSVPNWRQANDAEQFDGTNNALFTTPYGVRRFTEGYRTISGNAPPSSTSGYREGHIWYRIF